MVVNEGGVNFVPLISLPRFVISVQALRLQILFKKKGKDLRVVVQWCCLCLIC